MGHLLSAALSYAKEQEAKIIEGYLLDLDAQLTSFGGSMRITSTVREVGFVEVGRASSTQLLMRYVLEE